MTILVVDDNEDFRTAFADTLREDGHRVEEFSSPPCESKMRAIENVALVVTDFHMPFQDGLDFADVCHGLYPNVPVIVVTTNPSPLLEAEIRRRPHTLLCHKPLSYAELHDLIEAAEGLRLRGHGSQ